MLRCKYCFWDQSWQNIILDLINRTQINLDYLMIWYGQERLKRTVFFLRKSKLRKILPWQGNANKIHININHFKEFADFVKKLAHSIKVLSVWTKSISDQGNLIGYSLWGFPTLSRGFLTLSRACTTLPRGTFNCVRAELICAT